MFSDPFRLRSPLSASSKADGKDTLRTKSALRSLGFYAPPSFGMTEIPDSGLFDGIKRFQREKGLKVDGIMKPGGETERTIDKLITKRTLNPASKPAKAASSIAPGEHDWMKQSTPDVLKAPAPAANTVIETLLDVIKKKAANDEVVAESQRTVKAALKTSDHTGLAKVHADAVRDFGDGALAELFEFQHQLGAANKDLHKTWLTAFAKELPDEARKMTEAIRLLATGSGNDDVLAGGSANDDLKPKLKREMKPAPRKPEYPQPKADTLATKLAGRPEFKGIDLEFIHEREDKELRTVLYVPRGKNGKIIEKSGVTVGYGIDLGQMDVTELQRLGKQYGLDSGLVEKLEPYTGKIKDEAVAALKANPLTISEEEAWKLSTAKYTDTMLKLRRNVNKHLGSHGEFDSFPDPVKTVVFDLAIQYGPNFLDQHDRFRARLQEGILKGMIDELKSYGDNFPSRREDEANELAKLLQSWRS